MNKAQEASGAKVSLAEYLVVMQVLAIFELTDLGEVMIVLKLVSLAGTGAYFIYSYSRGLPNGAAIVASAADMVPVFGMLPMRMAGYTVAVFMANNPSVVQVVGKLAVVAGAAAATGGAGAAAGGAVATGGSAGAAAGVGTAAAATAGAAPTGAGTVAGGVTTRTATGTATSSAGRSAGATTAAGPTSGTPTGASTSGGATTSGAAQYAQEVQLEQDPLFQLNKQLTQQTPGTIDRPSGGRDDVTVNDDTNTVQLPYAT